MCWLNCISIQARSRTRLINWGGGGGGGGGRGADVGGMGELCKSSPTGVWGGPQKPTRNLEI